MSKKVFVSLPMYGRTDEDILEEQQKIFDNYVNSGLHKKGEEFELLETFFSDQDHDEEDRLWYLGLSIQKLSEADIVIFADGWERSNGCQIEHYVCIMYRIPYIIADFAL